ncbi:MAG: dihydrolipoyl dehydrogenase [Candidatus Eisenbacteria sp.]|nr:dihydrolipoyl dehydrogenase [Candidatus Eisenbacteria bacterium]
MASETREAREVDLAVIGGGPGGYVAALRAARRGLRTALIEREEIGGVCLNWGCIPTKALLRAAHVLRTVGEARSFGIATGDVTADYDAAVRRSRQAVDRLVKGVSVLLREGRVTLIRGSGRLIARREEGFRIGITAGAGREREGAAADSDEQVLARKVILATGARARALPNLPFDGERVLSSRDALGLREVPRRILIVGAGAIGLEFAEIFRSFGAEVTVVEMMPQILPGQDVEVAGELKTALARRRVRVRLATILAEVTPGDGGLRCRLAPAEAPAGGRSPAAQRAPRGAASKEAELEVDRILVAVGVAGNTTDLGLEAIGVESPGPFLAVDTQCRTGVPGLYAIGDLIGPPLLAHAASAEGLQAAEHAAGEPRADLKARWIPGVVFTHPPVASVGLTEAEARAQGVEVSIGRFPFRASGRAVAEGETRGLVKVILDRRSQRLLGAQIVGPGADESIAELALIGRCGIPARDVLETVHAHPTLSEAIPEAIGMALGEGLHA